jgi:hypothetical protein
LLLLERVQDPVRKFRVKLQQSSQLLLLLLQLLPQLVHLLLLPLLFHLRLRLKGKQDDKKVPHHSSIDTRKPVTV